MECGLSQCIQYEVLNFPTYKLHNCSKSYKCHDFDKVLSFPLFTEEEIMVSEGK